MSTAVTFIVPAACYLLGEAIANALWGETFPCYAGVLQVSAVGGISETPSSLAEQTFFSHSLLQKMLPPCMLVSLPYMTYR
jgi:hypothetical protein